VLTPNGTSVHDVRALDAGANLCLAKPVGESELLSNVAVQLRLWRLQAELRRQLEWNQALLSRLKVDLSLGQQVQQSFLPPSHLHTLNYHLDACLIPSGDLSGDYFDYRLVTPERLVLFLADVSGHGIASALLASRLKAFFDGHFFRAHHPQELLAQLNQVLIELGEHDHIATAMFVNIDVRDAVLTYASSGHRTLYWLDTETGDHHALPASGPALGMFTEYDIQQTRRSFLPGRNRLVAFTDGLVEFKLSDGSWHTEDQFCETVLFPAYTQPLEQYVQGLLDSSRERNQHQRWEDDVSLLVVDF
jgi:sigma-B regulation protein RsbU (phosphoserine phosphatase)